MGLFFTVILVGAASIVALAVSPQIDTLISMAAKATVDVFLIDLSPALSRQRDQFGSISAKTV
jgi:hypothetical protein